MRRLIYAELPLDSITIAPQKLEPDGDQFGFGLTQRCLRWFEEYDVACLYNNSSILTTEDSNNWPKLKYLLGRFFYAVWNKYFFSKKKKDSLLHMPLRSRTLFFHSVHTFVVYRSIAAMYKLTITPHGEYRTFSHINIDRLCLDDVRFIYNVHVIYL